MKLFAALAASLCLTLVAAAPRPAEGASKERLTIGISQYPSTLHPSFDSMLAKSYVAGMARRKITVFDPDWELACLLCTALPSYADGTAVDETAESGDPGVAVTYELKEGLVWGDGTPITTEDVRFTWEVGHDQRTGVDAYELYRRIDRVDVHDARRFTLHINKRTCDYQGINDFNLLPAHIERPIFESGEPGDYKARTAYQTDPTNPGLWMGPYRVAEVVTGQRITLERNPRWWGARPYFDEIVVRTIENTAALTANLLSGDIDMIAGELGLAIDQALAFEERHGERFQIRYNPGLIYEHLDVMFDHPALGERPVRQALIQAIDRQAISERLFGGRQPVAHGNVNPLDAVYYEDVPKYAYDPVAAQTMLEDAGWAEGPDGVRVKDGERLAFTLMTTAGNKSREQVQQVLQAQWGAIGAEVTIQNEPPRVFFGRTVSERRFEGLAMFAWLSSPQSIPRTTLHSDQIPTEENSFTGQNYPGYANPEMDRIIDGLETECAEEDQQRLWRELQTLYAADLPAIPLYFRANSYILPKGLEGLRPTGHQYPSTLWIEEWRLAQ
ncbi:MAG: peptide ABC transporter substrate-binding protein [Marivibrio sp.]|uniref:peptide ABC transporter substrate-binding protein n=1 Tax=Marivibrio sp. TaxID=2039719 RepID=UPI0032EBF128